VTQLEEPTFRRAKWAAYEDTCRDPMLHNHGLTVDPAAFAVRYHGRRLPDLPLQQLLLLCALMRNVGTTLTYNELQRRVWPSGGGSRRALTTLADRLRRYLRDNHVPHQAIRAVRAVGYILDLTIDPLAVTTLPDPAATPHA
jgi:DNA-binding response OmpR family regulator